MTRFRVGDEVFGETTPGFQWVNGGAFAEHVAAPAERAGPEALQLTFEQAAAVPTSGLIAVPMPTEAARCSGQPCS